jgi:hypothetical protein
MSVFSSVIKGHVFDVRLYSCGEDPVVAIFKDGLYWLPACNIDAAKNVISVQ